MAVFTDEFPPDAVVWNDHRFTCLEHARWAILFSWLKLRWEYRIRKEAYDRPEPRTYKPSKRRFYYEPPFWVPGLGAWVDIRAGRPHAKTLQESSFLAERSGHPVAIFRGPMYTPNEHMWPPSVPITMVYGQADIRPQDRFLVERWWHVKIDVMRSLSEVCTDRLLEAFNAGMVLKDSELKGERIGARLGTGNGAG